MTIEGIYALVSGMRVAGRRVQNSAHNVANASTPGYVPTRVNQADQAGGGSKVTGTSPTTPGPIVQTGQALDLALEGGGFFALNQAEGGVAYTRSGTFALNRQGQLVDQLGRTINPGVEIPADASYLNITPDGRVRALSADGRELAAGQIETASFGNPGGLEPLGNNSFQATQASGPAVYDIPGTEGHGKVISGALQMSGTNLATEMINMMLAQRQFEAGAAGVRTMDEMMGSILDIKA